MVILITPPAGSLREPWEKYFLEHTYPKLKRIFDSEPNLRVRVSWNEAILEVTETVSYKLQRISV